MKGGLNFMLINFARHLGFNISRIPKLTDKLLINVFDSNYKRRVLVSYLKEPFIKGVRYRHSNNLECKTAAEVLHELGYSVDVVHFLDGTTVIDYKNYEAIYGFGIPFEQVFYSPNLESIIKILYSPGCSLFYSNKVSALRVEDFFKTTGKIIPESSRVLKYFWTFQYILSDYIIALGNQFVANTFLEINPKLTCQPINAFYFDVYDIDLERKNFANAKQHFLWFGSSGLLHKGLDLLIDIFSKRQDIFLHICGAPKSETGFWEYYQPIVEKCKNIQVHGFVDINSEQFIGLMNNCAFCIFPSVSEGGSPSLLNVMANGGLIPITSETCGVDIGNWGFTFEKFDKKSIETEIENALFLDAEMLREKSICGKKTIRENYNYQHYRNNLKMNISEALKIGTK